jgi:hypothetical protein
MGDPGRVAKLGNIGIEINLLYIELFFISHGKSVILVTYIIIVGSQQYQMAQRHYRRYEWYSSYSAN